MKKALLVLLCLACALGIVWAGPKDDDSNIVRLVVTGDGSTEQDAVMLALRTAIEQAYGCFISSNTTILNDELVSDEIVSVSSGNIKEYKVLSSATLADGRVSVNVQAAISLKKLSDYSVSKGATIEFDGQSVANTIRAQRALDKLYAENEDKAIMNLCQQLFALMPDVFDYELTISNNGTSANFSGEARVMSNSTTRLFIESIQNTFQALSLDADSNKKVSFIKFFGDYYYFRSKSWEPMMTAVLEALRLRAWDWRITSQDPDQVLYKISQKDLEQLKYKYEQGGMPGWFAGKSFGDKEYRGILFSQNEGKIQFQKKSGKGAAKPVKECVLFSYSFSFTPTEEQLDAIQEIKITPPDYKGTILMQRRDSYKTFHDGDVASILAPELWDDGVRGMTIRHFGNPQYGNLTKGASIVRQLRSSYIPADNSKFKYSLVISANSFVTITPEGHVSVSSVEYDYTPFRLKLADYTQEEYKLSKPMVLTSFKEALDPVIQSMSYQANDLVIYLNGKQVFPSNYLFESVQIPGPYYKWNMTDTWYWDSPVTEEEFIQIIRKAISKEQ